jgi:alkyl hydroperoxide reductase subunit AhpC
MADDHGLKFPLLSDPDLAVIRAYGVADEGNGIAWPADFLIDSAGPSGGSAGPGVIRWRATAESVGTRTSANDVLRAFDEAAR